MIPNILLIDRLLTRSRINKLVKPSVGPENHSIVGEWRVNFICFLGRNYVMLNTTHSTHTPLGISIYWTRHALALKYHKEKRKLLLKKIYLLTVKSSHTTEP